MSIFTPSTLGWADNQIVFNDYDNFPIYRTQTRAPVQFNISSDDIPNSKESGINDFRSLIGRTTYVIQGTMYPKDEDSYYNGIAALRKVCSVDLAQNSSYNVDQGYMPYVWGESTKQKLLWVKPMYVQIQESVRAGFVQPFTIYLKIKDPTIFGATLKTATTATSSAYTTTGSSCYPIKYPVLYGARLYTVSAVANNNGNIPTYPQQIQIYGPINKPKITNEKTGEFIEINDTLSSSSNVITIQYDKSKLKVEKDGNSVIYNVTDASTYFKIQPGENIIKLSGASDGVTGLVTNGSFEVDVSGWTSIGTGGTITRVTTDHHTGSACASVTATSGQRKAKYTLSETKDNEYTIMAWIKATAGKTIDLYADGPNGTVSGFGGTTTGDWQLCSVTWTPTVDLTGFEIRVTDEDFLLDDVTMTKNSMSNGSYAVLTYRDAYALA